MELYHPWTNFRISQETVLYKRASDHLELIAKRNPGVEIDDLLKRIVVDFTLDRLRVDAICREHQIIAG